MKTILLVSALTVGLVMAQWKPLQDGWLYDNDCEFWGCSIDVGNMPAATADLCPNFCTNFQRGCNAYTWSTDNGGTCWLKTISNYNIQNRQHPKGMVCGFQPITANN